MAVTNYMTVNGQIRSEHRSGEAKSRDYLHDHLGNVVAVFQNDWMVGVGTYDPSGEFLSAWQMSSYKLAWGGGLGVRSTGLEWSSHYGRARHYAFMDGRFTTSWKRKGYNFNLQAVMVGMKRGFGGSIVAQSSQWKPLGQQPARPRGQQPNPVNTGPTAPSQTGGNELPAQPSGRIFKDRPMAKFGPHGLNFANCLLCCASKRALGQLGSWIQDDCSSYKFKFKNIPMAEDLVEIMIPGWDKLPKEVQEAILEEWDSNAPPSRLSKLNIPKKEREAFQRAFELYKNSKKILSPCKEVACEAGCLADLLLALAIENVHYNAWQLCGLTGNPSDCDDCCNEAVKGLPHPGAQWLKCKVECTSL